MLSASRAAIAALIVGSSISVAATPFDFPKDVLLRPNTRDANLTDAVRSCTSSITEVCNYGSGKKCGFAMCGNCLGLFPLLSNCCTSQQGYDLDLPQIKTCMYQYAVWTEDGNNDVVSIYPSLTRPPPAFSASTDIYTNTYPTFTSTITDVYTYVDANTSTVPIPFAAGATSAAATTSGATATAASSTNGATTSPPPAKTTTTSGAASQTSAAASGPTTTNGADKFTASSGQQLGFFGVMFMGWMSLFLL